MPIRSVPAFEPARFGIFGESPAMRLVLEQVDSLRMEEKPIWAHGESGTGKTLLVKLIHECSLRAGKPCGRKTYGKQSADLLESELFGHVRGAFTGATAKRKGLLLSFEGGTFFIDECDRLPLDFQHRLLTVLEDGELWPVGADKSDIADVRFIFASKASPEQLLRAGLLREDFFFRVGQAVITLPPLRERLEDVPLLVAYFLRRGKKNAVCSKAAMKLLQSLLYPGNLRELDTLVNSAAREVPEGGVIEPEHIEKWRIHIQPLPSAAVLPGQLEASRADRGVTAVPADSEAGPPYKVGDRYMTEEEHRREYRQWMIRKMGFKSKAADALGIDRGTLKDYRNADGSLPKKRPGRGKKK